MEFASVPPRKTGTHLLWPRPVPGPRPLCAPLPGAESESRPPIMIVSQNQPGAALCHGLILQRDRECLLVLFSNPRTECILCQCDNCLQVVIKKNRVLSFPSPPQILADLSSRVSAPLDACHLDSPNLPAYPCRIGGLGHVLTNLKAIILRLMLSSLCMSLSGHFSFLTTFLFPCQ